MSCSQVQKEENFVSFSFLNFEIAKDVWKTLTIQARQGCTYR